MTDTMIQEGLVFENLKGVSYKVKNLNDLDAWVIVDIMTANAKGEEVYETSWLERKLDGDETFRAAIMASLGRVRPLFSHKHNHMVVIWDPEMLTPDVARRVITFMAKQGTPLYSMTSPPDLQPPPQPLPTTPWEPAAPARPTGAKPAAAKAPNAKAKGKPAAKQRRRA